MYIGATFHWAILESVVVKKNYHTFILSPSFLSQTGNEIPAIIRKLIRFYIGGFLSCPQSDEHPENYLKRALLIMQSPAFSTRKNCSG